MFIIQNKEEKKYVAKREKNNNTDRLFLEEYENKEEREKVCKNHRK